MRNRIAILSAALAVGGLGFSSLAQDGAPTVPHTPRQQDAPGMHNDNRNADQNRQSDATFNQEQMDEARKLLGKLTELAVTKDSVDDIIEWFTDEDQRRFENFELTEEQQNTLNGRIEQIQRDFQAKYDSRLSIDADRVFADGTFSLRGPDAGDQARMASDRPGQNQAHQAQGDRATIVLNKSKSDTQRDGMQHDQNRQAQPGQPGGVGGIDADRNRQYGDRDEITVPVVMQDGTYRIDVPDSVDGQKLYDNLLYALTEVGNNVDSWPADQNEAARKINMKVLAAVTDSLKDKSSDQNRPDGIRQRDNNAPTTPGGM
jgi:hypothetical protein